ncbi:hypothetical protein JCM13304A_24390 [Desulfothermus okinawensis JCM 13304]
MILPEPESDLRMNILILGNEILGELIKNNNAMFIEDLLIKFLKKDIKRTPKLFMDAITTLYTLDLIVIESYKIKVVKHDKAQKTLF